MIALKYVIDRIIGDTAVLEGYDGTAMEVSVSRLPDGAKEGSSVTVEGDAVTLYTDAEREARIAAKKKAVWRR